MQHEIHLQILMVNVVRPINRDLRELNLQILGLIHLRWWSINLLRPIEGASIEFIPFPIRA